MQSTATLLFPARIPPSHGQGNTCIELIGAKCGKENSAGLGRSGVSPSRTPDSTPCTFESRQKHMSLFKAHA